MLDDPLAALPAVGRVFRARRKVRLADASPSQRLRLDACARYLQDIGNDDTADSGLDEATGPGAGVWVVRRAVVDLVTAPRWTDWVDMATWCSGTGGRWAERRLSIVGERGGQIEISTLWVHLSPTTFIPTKLPDAFQGIYGESALGRRVSAKHWLGPPPDGGEGDGAHANLDRIDWPLRAVDFDVMDHVNNAAYWAAIEEVLAARPDHPTHPSRGAPVRAVLEFGSGIGRDADVELLVRTQDKQLDIWFMVDGQPGASARLIRN